MVDPDVATLRNASECNAERMVEAHRHQVASAERALDAVAAVDETSAAAAGASEIVSGVKGAGVSGQRSKPAAKAAAAKAAAAAAAGKAVVISHDLLQAVEDGSRDEGPSDGEGDGAETDESDAGGADETRSGLALAAAHKVFRTAVPTAIECWHSLEHPFLRLKRALRCPLCDDFRGTWHALQSHYETEHWNRRVHLGLYTIFVCHRVSGSGRRGGARQRRIRKVWKQLSIASFCCHGGPGSRLQFPSRKARCRPNDAQPQPHFHCPRRFCQHPPKTFVAQTSLEAHCQEFHRDSVYAPVSAAPELCASSEGAKENLEFLPLRDDGEGGQSAEGRLVWDRPPRGRDAFGGQKASQSRSTPRRSRTASRSRSSPRSACVRRRRPSVSFQPIVAQRTFDIQQSRMEKLGSIINPLATPALRVPRQFKLPLGRWREGEAALKSAYKSDQHPPCHAEFKHCNGGTI